MIKINTLAEDYRGFPVTWTSSRHLQTNNTPQAQTGATKSRPIPSCQSNTGATVLPPPAVSPTGEWYWQDTKNPDRLRLMGVPKFPSSSQLINWEKVFISSVCFTTHLITMAISQKITWLVHDQNLQQLTCLRWKTSSLLSWTLIHFHHHKPVRFLIFFFSLC